MESVVKIGTLELALASGFVALSAAMSIAMALKIEKQLIISTVRMYVQLLALGFVLKWIFLKDSPAIVIAALLLMTAAATSLIMSRVRRAPGGLAATSFLSVFISGFVVTFAVTSIVIGVQPWHRAQYVIPIAGMVIGNSMNGVAIALERLFDDMRKRRDEIHAMLALGAGSREAAESSLRVSLSAGLIPVINSMSAAGIVSIPGMMTGQILAGADPAEAARYQIVVLMMLAAATAIGTVIAVELGHKRAFDAKSRFILKQL